MRLTTFRFPLKKYFWLLAACVLLLDACRKPDEDLGLDLLPGDPLGNVIDTATLHAFTVADTSIRTSGLTKQLLGSFVDPEFGFTRASIVTELRMGSTNIGSGLDTSGLVADSIVLAFGFAGADYGYGNLDPQVFEVYELTGSLSIDSTYQSDRHPLVIGEDLMAVRGGRITPRPLTKPYILGDSAAPQLRLRLSNALAERFLNAFNTNALSTNATFLEFFKGVHVTVNNGAQAPFQHGIFYFDLLAASSKMTLYYRDQNDTPDLTRALDFPINSNCVRYTVLEQDRGRAIDPRLAMALLDTSTPATHTYVQTLAGLRTVITMPTIADYNDQRVVLAKAELILPLDGSYYPYYPPPSQLILFRRNEDGADAFLPDQLLGIGAIDGLYRSDENAYHFNITRYVQGVINGTYADPRIEIVPSSGGVTANRVVLRGPAALDSPMRLRLTFTSY